jgi:hypothetical protein
MEAECFSETLVNIYQTTGITSQKAVVTAVRNSSLKFSISFCTVKGYILKSIYVQFTKFLRINFSMVVFLFCVAHYCRIGKVKYGNIFSNKQR